MSQIQEGVRARVHNPDDEAISSTHTKPPLNASFEKGNANTKLRTLKAITESIYINNEYNKTEKNEIIGRKQQQNYFAYLFYKILLVGLFIVYGAFRYAQYQYNRVKLRIYDLVYNPSNTPQLIRQDVLKLDKIPKRVAAILDMKPIGDVGGGLTGLLNDSSELICWTVSAGIKHLTLYDFDGVLQKNVTSFREEIHNKLSKYYGPSNVPKFVVRIPHSNSMYFNRDDSESEENKKVAIEISLLSNRDGRETIVDLTKTMADLCTQGSLDLSDVTMDLVDSELTQLVGPEPDLLVYFGPSLDLQGFPPWHIRLTEFYWEPDNTEVTYSVFIRALKKFSSCKMNVGK
ncbi:hypothetical protein KAFR_0L01300 [Kazachstania africana CBS 2517]|uniref:ditrans,polycis-polyprenyl diphosphate synthase [(2E,6E)-farnesyldiphosphate specific] n=1 Tax=Kazachstania africana (strain ATCC 22294 / BCRC 22015 / CBS 2517 / CECT 1963 / NBRC 1671 / NRRL Y-8276) TaxID=1071382 RepID=H2B289_KAZAF|nr:hypothetical protein KAFR_0L01300 [Kazachstania africana CBS 2517]CCF60739.1 hypothetical protein KAFR_0L01300 [Kazachstania africana CBS 2517]